MGQRLVIYLKESDEPKAAIYYHWSAYFAQAIFELNKVCRAILDAEKNNKDVILAIERMLESDGGGIYNEPDNVAILNSIYPGEEFKLGDRSYGLLAISEQAIHEVETVEEGTIDVFLDDRDIMNNVTCSSSPFDLHEDEGPFNGHVTYEDQECPVNPFEMTIETVSQAYEFIKKSYNDYVSKNLDAHFRTKETKGD